MTEKQTIGSMIGELAHQFSEAGLYFGHGTDNALDEAAWLVLNVVGKPLDGSFDGWQEPLDDGQVNETRRLARARCETGRPLAYLLGTAWFAGMEFEVNEDVLVPRSPIAELIRDGFSPWVKPERLEHVLDMCTGSGCIGIATAARLPDTRVDLADISPAALAVARRNVDRHGLGNRVRLFQSDLFRSVPEFAYGLIVANPPYVPDATMQALPREYREEPELGLASGADGLDAPLQILLDAPRYLCEYGVLVCEVGESDERLDSLLPSVPFTWLEFEHGGSGVFVLDRDELQAAIPAVSAAMELRANVT